MTFFMVLGLSYKWFNNIFRYILPIFTEGFPLAHWRGGGGVEAYSQSPSAFLSSGVMSVDSLVLMKGTAPDDVSIIYT